MTGEQTRTETAVVCPSCGEVYDSPDLALRVLWNSGCCINITCLTDLSKLPLEAVLARKREGIQAFDRRAG
jgi:hypothetical protein